MNAKIKATILSELGDQKIIYEERLRNLKNICNTKEEYVNSSIEIEGKFYGSSMSDVPNIRQIKVPVNLNSIRPFVYAYMEDVQDNLDTINGSIEELQKL